MDIRVLRGRTFTVDDGPTAAGVCVINHAAALRLFPSEDPIGRRVRMGNNPQAAWLTVVGVIGDILHGSLEETPRPELYITARQNPPVAPFVVVRTSGDPIAIADAVRTAVRSIDPLTPIYDMRAMTEIRRESVSERRFLLTLVGVFGALALVLAAVGVYGVMAVVVSERTVEVGARARRHRPRPRGGVCRGAADGALTVRDSAARHCDAALRARGAARGRDRRRRRARETRDAR
jgi:hypothetical protein